MPPILRHKVDVQQVVEGKGAYLDVTQSWGPKLKRVRCQLSPISSRERVFSAREGTQITHRMHLLKLRGIVETDRIVWKGQVFEIKGIRNLEEHQLPPFHVEIDLEALK